MHHEFLEFVQVLLDTYSEFGGGGGGVICSIESDLKRVSPYELHMQFLALAVSCR